MSEDKLFPKLVKKLRELNPKKWKSDSSYPLGYYTKIGRFKIVIIGDTHGFVALDVFDDSYKEKEPLKSYNNAAARSLYKQVIEKRGDYFEREREAKRRTSLRDLSTLLSE